MVVGHVSIALNPFQLCLKNLKVSMKKINATIVLDGHPFSKKRHRSCIVGRHIHNYDTQSKEKYWISMQMLSQITESFISCYCFNVDFEFYFPMPKSWSEKKKDFMDLRPHVSKPDRDNLEKIYLDAGNGIIWSDDCKVCSGSFNKVYSRNPKTIIYITGTQFVEEE